MRLIHFVIIISVPMISGCATNAQNQIENTHKSMENLHAQIIECYDNLNNNTRIAPLNKYLPLKTDDETIEQLSNTKKPTIEETKLLSERANQSRVCSRIGINGYASTMPQMVPILQERSDRIDNVYVQLIKQKITWGDALQILKAINSDFKQKEMNIKTVVYNSQLQQHNAEIAQRQRAAAVMGASMQNAGYQMQQNAYQQQMLNQNQQIINNMNRPVNTTCNSFGSTVNCTSR